MKPSLPRLLAAAALVILTGPWSPAMAATDALFYREVERDGAIYVFTTPQGYQTWRDGGRLPVAVETPENGSSSCAARSKKQVGGLPPS